VEAPVQSVCKVAHRHVAVFSPKDKGKVLHVLFLTERHAMKADWGSGGIAPHIL